ncbi:hypothetical protein H4R26_002132 [Coemansia thaxteri]|uniref:Uncharacterized protein n=1 Tax=Coemansia thaxteri TaxID=2663907 RepID=A0A9W8EJT5_9FUNG|nr:hypothetical protein H4R26_002132 [Coemansia thaxteri]
MDYIESKAHLDQPKPNNDQRETLTESLIAPSLLHALQRDLSTSLDNLVPEPTEEEKAGCRSYQVSARTMADGSIETRKVLCANDGTTTTTVTRHHPDSQKEDGVTVFQHK